MQTATIPPQLSEIHLAAQQLGVSGSLLRKLERQQKIPPALRSVGGMRLYTPEMIEAIRAAREVARDARQVGVRA